MEEEPQMTKDEFAEELRKRGYDASKEHDGVVVISPDYRDLRKVQAIAQEVGYGLSFGWRKEMAGNGA